MDQPWRDDSRGILDPAAMAQAVHFERHAPAPELDGIVDWFWAVRWDFPDGAGHDQSVLGHPSANLSIGHQNASGETVLRPLGHLYGPTTKVTVRRLRGRGWTVALKTTCGGLGALYPGPARDLVDGHCGLGALGVDEGLVEECGLARIEQIGRWVVERADPARVATAREVAAISAAAERNDEVRVLSDLAAMSGVGGRTLQRMFAEFVGLTPLQAIRRWRILAAAESVARGQVVDWAELAHRLGYSDQPHLVRDFTRHLGVSPAVYAARQRV